MRFRMFLRQRIYRRAYLQVVVAPQPYFPAYGGVGYHDAPGRSAPPLPFRQTPPLQKQR
jgi:hypothetical protein